MRSEGEGRGGEGVEATAARVYGEQGEHGSKRSVT